MDAPLDELVLYSLPTLHLHVQRRCAGSGESNAEVLNFDTVIDGDISHPGIRT